MDKRDFYGAVSFGVTSLIIVCFLSMIAGSSNQDTEYKQLCTAFVRYGKLVSFRTEKGDIYDVEDNEEIVEVGDKVIATFSDNATPDNIYDDVIKNVEVLR